MAGQPKASFYVAVALVAIGLVTFGLYRGILAPEAKTDKQQTIDPSMLGQKGPVTSGTKTAESPDSPPPPTTVKEYTFKPAERLTEIKGSSAYKPMENNTVKFALNVWAGWGPIILANDGFKPGKVWKAPNGKDFRVELVLIDDPATMIATYASGDVHIGWGTLDMVPLFVDGMVDRSGKPKDSRIMPRIYQQIDWSNGGDGIVVRKDIKNVSDLRDRKIVLAQNSPSQYFLLNMLVMGGVQPSEVNMIYTNTAFEAAAAFNADKSLSGAVSWAPDIYNLEKHSGNRMLVTTQTANKLIADVWFARADFAKDNPEIMEGLVRGIFDAMEEMKKPEKKDACSKLMAAGYNIPASDAMSMFADAHNTNWAENYQFFLNQNNPTNFEKIWGQSCYLYRQINTIQNPTARFDQIMDFSIIQKLGSEEKYKAQKDEYEIQWAPKTVGQIRAESGEIITSTVVIRFFPNDWDLHKKITRKIDDQDVETLYDPNVDNVLEDIAKNVGKFGAGRVIIEGHTDSSLRGKVPVEAVKELSMNRANAVKEALIQKYKFDPNRLLVDGLGWDRPADPTNPFDQTKNRRVEIKVYPAEQQ